MANNFVLETVKDTWHLPRFTVPVAEAPVEVELVLRALRRSLYPPLVNAYSPYGSPSLAGSMWRRLTHDR